MTTGSHAAYVPYGPESLIGAPSYSWNSVSALVMLTSADRRMSRIARYRGSR